jgi:hypothetical protein
MIDRHIDTTEWFRLFVSVVFGVFMGALVAQGVSNTPLILATATISSGVMLWLLRAYDP